MRRVCGIERFNGLLSLLQKRTRHSHGLHPRTSQPAHRPGIAYFGTSPLQATSVQERKQNGGPSDYGARKPSSLPCTCPGCGAYSQTHKANEPGFYDVSRRRVKAFLSDQTAEVVDSEDAAFNHGLKYADSFLLANLKISSDEELAGLNSQRPSTLICERCHDLVHHGHEAKSIVHPSLQSIKDLLATSPHKNNHIYHVLDAADFPMSLIPQLQQTLALTPLRSRNRRSRRLAYTHGNRADFSFVITRSDLLAPTKEQVDALLPFLTDVLRSALGRHGDGVRLGNVYCVSAKRGWWTTRLKEDIQGSGGCGWMVGKVNVGKSNLYESVFPKGLGHYPHPLSSEESRLNSHAFPSDIRAQAVTRNMIVDDCMYKPIDNLDSLLPPAPQEEAYPPMPTVSHLPGTTASPVRHSFGNGKGELIDLPGLPRSDIEAAVLEKHRPSLVMRQRIKAEQYSVKPGQSLIVSNLLRITPNFKDNILLACPFIPIECQVVDTESAKAILAQQRHSHITEIAKPDTRLTISSAGTYELKWDVTKNRAGPLTRRDAAGFNAASLPFVVYAADILLESVGWIELAIQVRKRHLETLAARVEQYPCVEVFSPSGMNIGVRPPMNAWMVGGKRKKPVSQRKSRPRRSMKGVKKRLKQQARLFP